MFDLVVTILAVLTIAISSWGLEYFAVRLFLRWRFRRDLGAMPSPGEVAELRAAYDRYGVLHYFDPSPTGTEKSTLD